jgi:DNA polymerase-1
MTETYFDLSKVLVGDIETDALYGYSTVHCAVFSDLEGNEHIFEQPSLRVASRNNMRELLHESSAVSGHNFIQFDIPALKTLLPKVFPSTGQVIDTLVLSRLINQPRKGGHSLAAWGETFGVKKEHADMEDFSRFTPELLERCRSDVKINVMVYRHFLRFLQDPEWQRSIEIEHFVQTRARVMHENGLPFEVAQAEELRASLSEKIDPIDAELAEAFPPIEKLIRTVTPRRTQKGYLNAQDFRWAQNREYTYDKDRSVVVLGSPRSGDAVLDLSDFDGSSFDLVEMVPFNPGSPSQIVARLNEAGWKPTDKTKGHLEHIKNRRNWKGTKSEYQDKLNAYEREGWKVSEENLATLPADAPSGAFKLAQRLTIASRLSDLDEWLGLVGSDGRLHGEFTGIGAWTHRMAHARPNTANIPVAKRSPKDTDFQVWVNDVNDAMRSLFIAPKGKRLIGTDADGIQMRIFAHLVGDERLIKALLEGNKEDGTDIHTLHKKALGDVCKSRDAAKTFIYAFLLGAGVAKVAQILECTGSQARDAVNSFLEFYPGLVELKDKRIPAEAARGYFIGLDGRKVVCDSEHKMLAGHLQNGEKIIMSWAYKLWEDELNRQGLPFDMLNWVHDEWQLLIDDDNDLAKRITDIQIQALRDTTQLLNLRCPMEGTTSKHKLADGSWFYGGYSWQETH